MKSFESQCKHETKSVLYLEKIESLISFLQSTDKTYMTFTNCCRKKFDLTCIYVLTCTVLCVSKTEREREKERENI